MHDVSGAALISRPDLPANAFMSKVQSVSEASEMAADHGRDPAMDSEAMSVSSGEADRPGETSTTVLTATIDTTHNAEKMGKTPQPVTPETPKVQEVSKVDVAADKEKVTASKASSPPPTGDSGAASGKKHFRKLSLADARPNRDRIVSLDGARGSNDADGYSSPDTKSLTDDEGNRRHAQGRSFQSKRDTKGKQKHYDDASSSDDDSSYFAQHLPSPKSGRTFSYSSAGSGHGMNFSGHQNSVGRESDASLSFSDESDDEMHQQRGVHISPMIPPKGTVADMHLYPQRITRMHSVSSLVSSESSGDERGSGQNSAGGRSSDSISSHTGTSSDPSVRAELHNMAVTASEGRPASHTTEASGRRSPIMGEHASPGYFLASPLPGRLKQSPPPIMQGYVPPPGMPHPEPQPMTNDQLAAWTSAGNAAVQVYQAGQQPHGYGSTMQLPQLGMAGMAPHHGGFRNMSEQTDPSLPFVYSEDDDGMDAPMMNQMAGGLPPAGGPPPASGQLSAQGVPGGTDPGRQQRQMPSGNVEGSQEANVASRSVAKVADGPGGSGNGAISGPPEAFQVYRKRWLMLFYMSVLNLISDWTCYSVAPIALLTEQAFGDIDPERLVVVFLGANAFASACEPIILSRLGLRRTVLFGSLLLMIGSIVKSGGVPPILPSDLIMGHDEWRLYFGFFLVGLSQPLYQCTPALLSASWFPEKERTMATGIALNSNQLGIGFAFVFGTLLVGAKEDIIPYFGLLSTISTIVFLGTLIQFDDAPPTPPSSSARVMRGTLEVNLPSIGTIVQSVRGLGGHDVPNQSDAGVAAPSPAASHPVSQKSGSSNARRRDAKGKKSSRSSSGRKGSATRRRATGSRSQTANTDSGLSAPSSARSGSTAEALAEINELKLEAGSFGVDAPSPVMPGRVGQADAPVNQGGDEGSSLYTDDGPEQDQQGVDQSTGMGENPMLQGQPGQPALPGGPPPPGMVPPYGTHPHYQYPYWDPRVQQQMQQQQQVYDPRVQQQMQQQQQAYYQQQYYYYQQAPQPPQPPQFQPPQPYYYPMPYPHQLQGYGVHQTTFSDTDPYDDGAEPILTITPHHLDIDIRDDQVIRSVRACFARPGFIHALVAFAVSGIVINTLSTYMDYLVTLNGAPSYYTGIVGGTFQLIIMISSLIVGNYTDKSRAYYSVTIGMLVLGAFGLAECGVSLDADKGSDLRWSLVLVAALVGPLQPVATEMGVDVVYPLSENTVLVVQQLFANLLSAMFIPLFKALKDVGSGAIDDEEINERPPYTFSFYLLIVLHTGATVFFATFNGKYLRYEHELQRKEEEEERQALESGGANAFHPFYGQQQDYGDAHENERQPLVQSPGLY
jgi:hypothetical protein